jgi:hypothetical protein
MKHVTVAAFVLWSLPAYAANDQSNPRRLVHVGQPVFQTLNANDESWSGYVQVSSSPCPDQPIISTQTNFSNAKDQEDVLRQIAPFLDVTEKTAEDLEKHCKK